MYNIYYALGSDENPTLNVRIRTNISVFSQNGIFVMAEGELKR